MRATVSCFLDFDKINQFLYILFYGIQTDQVLQGLHRIFFRFRLRLRLIHRLVGGRGRRDGKFGCLGGT